MTKIDTEILKTKPHFEILDGLRGVAALAIVIFHFMEIVYLPNKNFIAHGFLAVDFFFCLSGFVIAYAYQDRVGKMGITAFFKTRLIRLHPLVIFGSVLGLLAFLFDPFSSHPETYETGKLILLFLTSVFLIPFAVMPDRYFNLFGLNARLVVVLGVCCQYSLCTFPLQTEPSFALCINDCGCGRTLRCQ